MARGKLLAAAGLIVVGAAGDHIFFAGSSSPTTAAATATQANTTQTAFTSNTTTAVSPSAIDAAFESAYNTASQSVVYVVNSNVGSGSGIVYDTKGDIVTNYHVVEGGNNYSVTLNNGKTYKATLVGTDPADDLAVIKISASGLTPAKFATAGSYRVAQSVLAIGSPLGLKQSVTSGIISGLNRVEQEPNGAYLPNAIQTSAPINPGNSGGALVTLDGVVVGMPTLEQTGTNDGSSAQNIGFAIPSQRITDVASQIVATGKVEHTGRAYLGIVPADAEGSQGGFGYGNGGFFGPNQGQTPVSGALVSSLSSTGPAAKAGVQQGDVIVGANGQTVSSAQDLLGILANEKPGNTITLKINRNGQTLSLRVTLGELPG